jgi:integrase
MTRLAIVTGLCSGARIGDAVRMQHGWHDGAMMEFVTSKNKADVAVPMHPFWLAEIAAMPRRAVTILYERSGRPFQTTGALQARIRALMEEIGEEGFSFHGLRKNACCYLAELGLNDSEIGAIVGMTPQIVRHYTKRARALMIARTVHVDPGLALHPLNQFVELDRLLGSGQPVGDEKIRLHRRLEQVRRRERKRRALALFRDRRDWLRPLLPASGQQ